MFEQILLGLYCLHVSAATANLFIWVSDNGLISGFGKAPMGFVIIDKLFPIKSLKSLSNTKLDVLSY